MTRFDGVYALLNPLNCIDAAKLAEVHSFNVEVLQYKPVVTPMYICQCILTLVSHICNADWTWRAYLSTKIKELPISRFNCLLAAQVYSFEAAPEKWIQRIRIQGCHP